MGAPLIVKDEIIGVVAVQSYLDSNLYNEQDLQVLSGISDQMAIAIDRKKAEALLKESEEYLANIINTIGDPVFVKDEQFRFVLVNDAFCTFLGKTRDELVGTTGMEFLPKDQMDHFLEVDRKVLSSEEDQLNEESLTDGDSTIRIIVTKKTCYIDAQGVKFIVGVIRDITDRKQAEEEVKERTNELEDINIALKVLLKKGENDKKEMEEKISSNYKSLISPFIEKLKKRLTEKNQKNLMYIIESNMQEFFKPFSKKVSDQMLKLTPAEIQIASMIKEGLSNKEIAQILNNSVRTITNHRQHIRRKFDLENKKVNLRSYLSIH
jgi:PAS domain S-box-containing protein